MWIRSTYRALWLALLLCCVLGPGCSLDEAEANVRGAKKKIENLTPYVPTSHTYIPVGISALCTAALAVIRIIKERRNTNRMKAAIKAKAKQIDKIIAAPANPDPTKPNPVLAYMRLNHSTATGKKLAALNDFDAVREGEL